MRRFRHINLSIYRRIRGVRSSSDHVKNLYRGESMKNHRQLDYNDRIKIEALYSAKHTPKEIAKQMEVHISTIYRELKRGEYQRLDGRTWIYYTTYSAEVAQKDHDYKQSSKGAPLKIGNDHNLAAYIETMIIEHKQSPDAVIGRIRCKGITFDTSICTRTLYNYIDKGLFLHLTNKHLPMRGQRKRNYKKVRPVRSKLPLCMSIEKRPEDANERQFGHWEMDTVIGKAAAKPCLLVLTERNTRHELIIKLKSKSQLEVQKALNRIERIYGKNFPQVFKTITCDNGSEFINPKAIEQSSKRKGKKRTTVYYCHPYSSYERGSNENANSIIRRFIPKGIDISKYNDKQIMVIQSWMNNYPRRILGYNTSAELFNEQLQKIF